MAWLEVSLEGNWGCHGTRSAVGNDARQGGAPEFACFTLHKLFLFATTSTSTNAAHHGQNTKKVGLNLPRFIEKAN